MKMSSQQICHFRSLAHPLNPVVMIGVQGLTVNVHQEIDNALNAHQLIKIRISHLEKAERKKMVEVICQQHNATLIQIIGHIATIYRKRDENKN